MEKTKAILPIFLAVFLCLSVSAVYAQNNQYESYAQINKISLNGEGDYLIVEPGELVDVHVFYEFRCSCWISDDIHEVVIGLEDEPLGCLIDGLCDTTCGTEVFYYQEIYDIFAPTEPGKYHIMYISAKGYTCHDAREFYRNYPQSRKIIGTIEVIADDEESEEWKCIHNDTIALEGNRYYDILFEQRGNELRIELNTSRGEDLGIQDGSLSISINENVDIDYNTGNVSERRFGKTDLEKININPDNKVGLALFSIITGFVPGWGMCGSAIGFGEALYAETSEINVEEADWQRVGDRLGFWFVHEIFTENKHLNNRDVVVIPWKTQFDGIINGVDTIVVNCPDMEFPHEGTHDVVFCVDFGLLFAKHRYYVALPIDIGKQKKEWKEF